MIKPLSILCLSIALTGCGVFTAYKTPIQQGRIISQKQISQVKPGMSMAQIQFILGTPGVKDPFHTNTWNYVYIYKLGGQAQTLKKLTLLFKNDKLTNLSGDYVPPTALKYQYSNTPVTAKTATHTTASSSAVVSSQGPSTGDPVQSNSTPGTTPAKNKTTTRHPAAVKQHSGSTPTKNKDLWELS